ncbi:protein SMG7L-like isoform X2 [Mangifera indica]|uniref:protein SMG7L-like isoform X2 n=1 Tax=Mangifera indica TaxID=29780 RepID=UPI001CFA48AC|nr:protein SMG7L-like isoform X2 [Mangifera indica]
MLRRKNSPEEVSSCIMSSNSPVSLKYQKGKPNVLVEVSNTEKQLWTLIHSKGLLCSDVQQLYRKVCSSYEKIVLNDYDQAELQDVEFSLWKLHYKHIDEFRKRIKKSSGNSDNSTLAVLQSSANEQKSNGNHIEGFKSFLSEAVEFYQNLIVKIRRCYGLPEEYSFFEKDGISMTAEPKKLQKCQFLCHRFLVCLGDLARYKEQYEKFGSEDHNWSVAATYYLESTMIWPDSGNPQNQNRSSDLHSLSPEAFFDFLKPSDRSSGQIRSQLSSDVSNCNMLKAENICSGDKPLWSLIIRTVSFFFIKSSLEDFPSAFASMIGELDSLLELDDTNLVAMLTSYELMGSARTGPFRALQVVSVFVFILQKVFSGSEMKSPEDKNYLQELELTRFALTVAFIFIGRLVDRCLKSNPLDSCPLLPGVLVFLEWLVGMFDEVEAHGIDDKVHSAMSYFFGALVGFLQQLNFKGEVSNPGRTALWEDYELRGFAPLSCSHVSLDFSTDCGCVETFESGTKCRADRIIHAAMKIAYRTNGSQRWMIYDKAETKFYAAGSNVNSDRQKIEVELTTDLKVKEPPLSVSESTEGCDKQSLGENSSSSFVDDKSVAVEEEEVIVFKPLTRYNSAPLYPSIYQKESESLKDIEEQNVSPDDCLRRATSLLIAQNQNQGDPSEFHSDITNFRPSKPFRQLESPLVKENGSHSFFQTPVSAGPPSLSAWVFDRRIADNDTEKGRSGINKPGLSPIDEIASISLSGLSIRGNEESVICSKQDYASSYFSSPCSAPLPSAPLLPDNVAWIDSVRPNFSNFNNTGTINRTGSDADALQLSNNPTWCATRGPLDYGSAIPGFMDGYPPFRGLSSSEWLRQYRENHNLDRAHSHSWPLHFYAPRNSGIVHGQDTSWYDPSNHWQAPSASNQMIYTESTPLHPGYAQVHDLDEHRRDKLFHGYQRAPPYGCGVATDLRDEPQPLLQYLKENEWLLHWDPTLRGPSYTGN